MLALVGILVPVAVSLATTLKPLTGDDQIRESETIFRGKVLQIDTKRDWSNANGPVVSNVQFTPLAVYKGSATGTVSLKFLGGTAEGVTLKVDGMPKFEVGQEYVLFVSGTRNRVCPVVGWTEGQLKVDRQVSTPVEVGVTRTAKQWLRKTSVQVTRDGETLDVGLEKFETGLRERIRQVDGK